MAIYKTKTPTKDGRIYYFRIKYKDVFGKTHDYSSQKYFTLKEAKEEEAKFRIKVFTKATTSSTITLNQVFNEYLNYKKKELKAQSIRRINSKYLHLKQLYKEKMNNIDGMKYNAFLDDLLKKKLSIVFTNNIIGLLKSLITFSGNYYNTSTAVLKFIKPLKDNSIKKEMQFFTYEEYKKFDSVIDKFDYKVFFSLLYYMGLRQGEATALNWKDINFEKQELSISKTLTTKIKGEKWTITSPKTKNSIRVLPIPNNVLDGLKQLKNNAKDFKDFKESWFCFGNSMPFKETTICETKNKYCKKAGVKQIRIHDFRHSCASLLINKGSSIALVSKYLGHSNISITLNTYTHMYKSELENITNLLNNL